MSLLIKGNITVEELQSAILMFKGHEIVELHSHGDLIDRDAYRRATGMKEKCEECSRKHYSSLFICPVSRECYELEKAPVVIPAERSEE